MIDSCIRVVLNDVVSEAKVEALAAYEDGKLSNIMWADDIGSAKAR